MGNPRGRITVAVAIIVLGLVAALGGWWYGIGRYTVAPDLVNMDRAAATQQAERAGLTIAYGQPAYHETVKKDVVLAQDPPIGGRIVKGGTVTLTLSLGPERYKVPDVVGKQFDLATADLEKVKLTVLKGPDRYDDGLPAGVVIAVDPKAGTEVKPGDAVTVVVSKGKAPLTVPNLRGKNVNEARQILAQMELNPLIKYEQSDKPKDEVIDQNPADGTGVEKGANVTLVVSEGPPLVVVPQVTQLPCQQAQQTLEAQQLRVRIEVNPNGTVAVQNPGPNAQVPPQTEVVLVCL